MGCGSDFSIRDGVLERYTGNQKDVVIPEGVTEIGWRAFFVCTSLTAVSIPESVTKIGEDAFYGCASLTIHTPAGSYGEAYAKENDIPFQTV